MDLLEVGDGVFVTDGPTRVGVVVDDRRQALIVDAGLDEGAGRKLKRLLETNGFQLRAIILTHCHADHCGAAPWLVRGTGAKVYAGALERPMIEHPWLEPVYLFGGAAPPRQLRTRFFLAPGVKVDADLRDSEADLLPWKVQIVELPGHTLGQVGILAGDCLFCADSFLGPTVLEKHRIPVNMDVAVTLETYEALLSERARVFIPSHGELTSDVREAVTCNRNRVVEVSEFVADFCRAPRSMEDLISATCQRFGVQIKDMGMFSLMNLAVAAVVSYLMGQKILVSDCEGNRRYFRQDGGSIDRIQA